MLGALRAISSLLTGVAILVLGSGLLGTLLAVRGSLEGFADFTLGLIMSAYFAGFLIGTYLCPPIIRRVGHIRAFAMFASIASITPLWHALIVDPWFWSFLRVISGVCLVGLFTVIESWLNVRSPNDLRGRVFAAYMAVNFGALAIAQFLLLTRPPAEFDLFGVVATMFSLALVPIALTTITQPPVPESSKLELREIYRTAPVGAAGALISGLVMGAFWGLAPVMAQRLELGNSGVAALMSVSIAGGAALQIPIGRFSDSHDRRRVLAIVAVGGALVALLAMMAAQFSSALLIAFMAPYGGLSFAIYSVSVAHLNDRLEPHQVLAGASSLLLLHGIGAALGPAVAGLGMNFFGPTALLIYFAVMLTPLAIFTRIQLEPQPEPEPHPAPFVPMVRTSTAVLELLPTEAEGETAGPSAERHEQELRDQEQELREQELERHDQDPPPPSSAT